MILDIEEYYIKMNNLLDVSACKQFKIVIEYLVEESTQSSIQSTKI